LRAAAAENAAKGKGAKGGRQSARNQAIIRSKKLK